MMTRFGQCHGFHRSAVTLANWRMAPFSQWSFQNVTEIVPSISSAPVEPGGETQGIASAGLLDQSLTLEGVRCSLAEHLAASHTDLFVVMKSGRFIGQWSAPHADLVRPHLIFSVSKSLTAIVAGVLESEGKLAPEALVATYVPEAVGSAFGEATVRNLLDMTTRLDFDEAYLAPESLFARYRKAMLWNPGNDGEGLLAFLCSLKRLPGPYGDAFRYRSPNTDMLGIVLERASGERMADLLDSRLWRPLRARGVRTVTVDQEGTSRAAAGFSVTAHDLARVGEMMRQGGMANCSRILPQSWVFDTVQGGDRSAWTRGDFADLLPDGCYRNQWYQSGEGFFCGIGIHGQWLVVNPATESVIVKLSSQPLPVDESLDTRNLELFRALHQMI